MKKITSGILMLCLLAFATSVGYASSAPTSQHTQTGEKATFPEQGAEAPILLAQLEAPATELTATEAPEATPAPVVAQPSTVEKAAEQVIEIANALNVEVDTNASPDEIYRQVLEQAQAIPKKGSSTASWISWILAGLGLLGSVFFFVKNQKLKKGG